MLKFSDAIELGSMVLKPKACTIYSKVAHTNLNGDWLEPIEVGCALGMANKAIGDINANTHTVWPWTKVRILCPCRCRLESSVASMVAHLFDSHVFGKHDMTLKQLIEWVRSIEPQDNEQEESVNEVQSVQV